MASDKKNAPKAQISTGLLRDEDALSLIHGGKAGHQVMWAWVGLIMLSRQLDNGGVFRGNLAVYSSALGLSPKELTTCIDRMNEAATEYGNEPWIERMDGGFKLRSFKEYNRNWGGARENAGRAKQSEEEHKKRVRARNVLTQAIARGAICRPDTCEHCGDQVFVEGHHHDYAQPLNVTWLCTPCHRSAHSKKNQDDYSSRVASSVQGSRTPVPVPVKDRNTQGESGQGRAGEVRSLLAGLSVGDPALTVLTSHPDCTAELIRDQWAKCNTATNPRGALVGRLSRKLRVSIPKSNKSIVPALSTEAAKLVMLRSTRMGVSP